MRSIPIVTRNILIINIVVFIATWMLSGIGFDLNSFGGLHFFLADDFHIWQLVTYQFLHGGFTHILFNMFAVWMFGRVIESIWGPKKFLFYYISCGIGAGLMQEIAQFCSFYVIIQQQDPSVSIGQLFEIGSQLSAQLNGWTTIGASGAVYAVLLAFGMIFPNERIFIFPLPVPIKAKWFVTFYVVLELFLAFNSQGDGVAHMAHLGGMLFGFLMIRYWSRNPGKSNFNFNSFFERKPKMTFRQGGPANQSRWQDSPPPPRETDREYNERKKRNQQEIDKILDKIRKSGYDSLTPEEKKRLFDSSQDD